MKLHITNTLGIEQAEIPLPAGEIVWIYGPNASGKTSIALCAAAVLTRNVNPLSLPVSAKALYSHDGRDDAAVHLQGSLDDGEVVWRPGKLIIEAPSEGELAQPLSTPEAVAGVDFVARRGEAEQARIFHPLLLPPEEEVLEALRQRLATLVPDAELTGVENEIVNRGWQAAAAIYQERRRAKKREWRETTGAQYGKKIADDWRPAGWRAEWDSLTEEQAQGRVSIAQTAQAELQKLVVISEADHEQAVKAHDSLPGWRTALEDVVEEGHEAQRHLADASQVYDALVAERARIVADEVRLLDLPHFYTCPACGTRLSLVDQALVVFDEISEEVRTERESLRKKWQAQFNDCDRRLEEAGNTKSIAQTIYTDLQAQYRDAKRDLSTAEQTATLREAQTDEDWEHRLGQAQEEVDLQREALAALKQVGQATKLHQLVELYEAIDLALGPRGVRGALLEAGLQTLNATLAGLTTAAAWPPVEVSKLGLITIDGRPVVLASESERWRAQAALQLVAAALSSSRVVVLDRADVLDHGQRAALRAALERVVNKIRVTIVVCCTGDGDGENTIILDHGKIAAEQNS